MTKSEIITEARRRTEEGFFDRREVSREPEDLHWNRIMLECGHRRLESEMLHKLRGESADELLFCDDCAKAWIEDQTGEAEDGQ